MESLRALIRELPSVLLGYSGGVDSAFLAVVLRQELGKDRMLAVSGRSASYPDAQWQVARQVAVQFDIPLLEIETHELDDANYLANPSNRCFYCKTELWNRLVPLARERGFAVVCDGTNADDLHEHRPGKAAGQQAGVRSPLAEVGLTKAEIRAASRELGLPTWDAPAAPCLSSRVQYGLAITPSRLKQVERGEAFLRELGVAGDLRVRHLGDVARIEVEPSWIPWIETRRAAITAHLTTLGFAQVEIDPRGYRRGSLLERSSP
ncbi:MAG TPA: ATP-dependent sacrificial sulfur transferase LarE [Gemmatimonadales bacterium]|nr:ATP-dependent sacrificial sulfur transferase LarE [Gemmatimonadales bacterium]